MPAEPVPTPPLTLSRAAPEPAEAIGARLGQEIGVSDWITVDQPMIDAFATLTCDHTPVHVDPASDAGRLFGGTILHGFHTAALLAPLSANAVPQPEGARYGINYGLDRLRFVAPVPSGARIRGRFTLAGFERVGTEELRLTLDAVIEVEGRERPALVARWLTRWYF